MSVFTPKTVTLPDGAEVLLRSPKESEAQRLIEYLDTVRRETLFLMWGPDDDLPDLEAEQKWVSDRRADDGGVTILAESDGRIVSICGVDRQGPFVRVCHCAELGISIRKAWCDRGLGTILMNELIGWSEACPGLEVISLGVIDGNDRAVAVYTKFGFEAAGRKRWHVKRDGEYVDEIIMSRWVGALKVDQ